MVALQALALCMGLMTVPPIHVDSERFNAVCVKEWEQTGTQGMVPMACTDGREVYLPAHAKLEGRWLAYVGHEFGHIAGDADHDRVQKRAEWCLHDR